MCWGANGFGQLGDGTFVDRTPWVNVRLGQGFLRGESVAAGGNSSCAIVSSRAMCWGEVPGVSPVEVQTPTYVPKLAPVTALSVAADHACAIVSGGGVWCWGAGESGQLGAGAAVAVRRDAVQVSGTDGASTIALGARFSCALEGRRVKCWGSNAFGQLGDGTSIDRLTPVDVVGLP